jgi:hypothetical protein
MLTLSYEGGTAQGNSSIWMKSKLISLGRMHHFLYYSPMKKVRGMVGRNIS